MQSFKSLFFQTKDDKLTTLNIDLLDVSRLKDQPLMVSAIILLTTDKDTYVLTCSEGNGRINAGLGGWVTPKMRDKSCHEMILSLLIEKMYLPSQIKKQYPGLQSLKLIKSFLKKIKNSHLENTVCLYERSKHSHLTAVVSISDEEINLNKMITALKQLDELKSENTTYEILPLQTLLQYAKTSQRDTVIEICNAITIRALDINQAFRPWKKTPSLIFTYPAEIYLNIFRYLDDKDMLSFLLISPFFAFMLDKKNNIWKELVSPILSSESKKYLNDEDYKRIFIKKVFPLNELKPENRFTHAIKEQFDRNPLINIPRDISDDDALIILKPLYASIQLTAGSAFTLAKGVKDYISNDMFIHNKKISFNKLQQFIMDDNDIELVYAVSNMGELLPYILTYNKNRDEVVKRMAAINRKENENLSFNDIKSIAKLMPCLLDSHAEKCFEVLIKIYIFGMRYFLVRIGTVYSVHEEFTALIKPILDSDYPYFKLKLIQLVLEDRNSQFIQYLINLCIDMNMQELMMKVVKNNASFASIIHATLEDSEFISMLNSSCPSFLSDLKLIYPQDNTHLAEYKNECDAKLFELKNSLNEITNQIINNDLSSDELRIRSEKMQKIMLEMIQVKQNLAAEEDCEVKANNSFKL